MNDCFNLLNLSSYFFSVYVCFIMTFNGTSFLVIMSCYLKMYCDIRDSQAWNSPDVRVAKRMSLLIFTDFLCWMPITILSLTAMFGKELISLEEAKFFTIFVLPLNSCANPFLYAIFTKQFKRDCANFCRRLEESTINQGYGRHGNRHQQASWGSGRLASLMKLFWLEKRPGSEHVASSKSSLNVKDNSYESLRKKCLCPICEECLKLYSADDEKAPADIHSGKQTAPDIVLNGRKADSDEQILCRYKDASGSCQSEAELSANGNTGACSIEDERLINRVHIFQQPCSRSDESNTVMIPLEILHTTSEIPSTSQGTYDDFLPAGICTGSGCAGVTAGVNGAASNGSCGSSGGCSNGGCSSVSKSANESQYVTFCGNSNGGANGNNAGVTTSGGENNDMCQTRLSTMFRDLKSQKRGMNNDSYKMNPRRGCPQSCYHTVYSPKWAPAHQRLKGKSGLSIVPEEEKQENFIPRVKITEADDNDIQPDEVAAASASGSPMTLPKKVLPSLTQRQGGYRLLSTTPDVSCPDSNIPEDSAVAMISVSKIQFSDRGAEGGSYDTRNDEREDNVVDDDNTEKWNEKEKEKEKEKSERSDFGDSDTEEVKSPSTSLQASPRFRVKCNQRSLSFSTLKAGAPGREILHSSNKLQSLRPYHSAETVKIDRGPMLTASSLTVPSKVTRRIPSSRDVSSSWSSVQQTSNQ